jgi:hypothetical protein
MSATDVASTWCPLLWTLKYFFQPFYSDAISITTRLHGRYQLAPPISFPSWKCRGKMSMPLGWFIHCRSALVTTDSNDGCTHTSLPLANPRPNVQSFSAIHIFLVRPAVSFEGATTTITQLPKGTRERRFVCHKAPSWATTDFLTNIEAKFVDRLSVFAGIHCRVERGSLWESTRLLAATSFACRMLNFQLSSKLLQSFKSLQKKSINKCYSLKGLLPTKDLVVFLWTVEVPVLSMQELTNFPPLKLAQLLFLQTLLQANDHSRKKHSHKT